MSLRDVTLPGGGQAWIHSRLTKEGATRREAAFASLASARGMAEIRRAEAEKRDTDLAYDGIDMGAATRGIMRAEAETIRVAVHHWSGVMGRDGEALAFPDDVERLVEADFDALFVDCERIIREGRADPNASGRPSPSTSEPDTSSPTPPTT